MLDGNVLCDHKSIFEFTVLHQTNLTHTDLKPENMLFVNDEYEITKVSKVGASPYRHVCIDCQAIFLHGISSFKILRSEKKQCATELKILRKQSNQEFSFLLSFLLSIRIMQ